MISQLLRRWLAEPLAGDADIDSPEATAQRRRVLREKPLLRCAYETWLRRIAASLPAGRGRIVEVGSGSGFLREHIPDAVLTDILALPYLSCVADAQLLPFRRDSLRAIVMTNAFHHLPDPARFLDGAARCVRPGGAIVMIEPWMTPWSRLVYQRAHHERCDPHARHWWFRSEGPLSGANSAMPWILFERDRPAFARAFPAWRIAVIDPMMPLLYLVSGGFSFRALAPAWCWNGLRAVEAILSPWMRHLAMFARIVLVRTEAPRPGPQRCDETTEL